MNGSWGFFTPPRKGDHVIILAYLRGVPVGMAYLDRWNFNIDYGIHVLRNYWRMRIGTAILRKVLEISKELGAKQVSVVRVLRTPSGSPSDKRAALFYRVNNPYLRFNVCRLKNPNPSE